MSSNRSSNLSEGIALVGNPNCGKTSLFNALTGSRQKVGNYPGVTVERKEGFAVTPSGTRLSILDLPGTYSFDAATPDEMVTRDVIFGAVPGEKAPRVLIAVADATNLERNLGLVLELRDVAVRTDVEVILALNMMDLARDRGVELDLESLSRELGFPVIPTVAVRGEGMAALLSEVERILELQVERQVEKQKKSLNRDFLSVKPSPQEIQGRFAEVDRILKLTLRQSPKPSVWTDRIDCLVIHPFWGFLFLILMLTVMFQSIFTWAQFPMDWMKQGITEVSAWIGGHLSDGPLKSLILDGMLAGVGSVIVFLPQILILFLFILLLEDSGYMARAAFLMDRIMGKVGLHGRAFIPLLSSFACAVPGIMATRTIASRRDRLTTILIAPLMTCSARLPVYTLLISAFIPERRIFGVWSLQGLVMLALYLGAVVSGLVAAFLIRKGVMQGPRSPLLMELPTYKVPSLRSVALGLLERAKIFLRRAGTVILSLSVILWFLATYPKPGPADPVDTARPAILYSYAGKIGKTIEPLLKPLGFDWRISVALIPGFAAREVMVGALATVYSVENREGSESEDSHQALAQQLAHHWGLPTALSLLIWYVFACQCLSTLAVTRRETNSWRWPAFMLGYMTVLAYLASFVTYRIALGWGI